MCLKDSLPGMLGRENMAERQLSRHAGRREEKLVYCLYTPGGYVPECICPVYVPFVGCPLMIHAPRGAHCDTTGPVCTPRGVSFRHF